MSLIPIIASLNANTARPSFKNAQVAKDEIAYSAFGIFLGRHGNKIPFPVRMGTGHLTLGKGVQPEYDVSTDTWDQGTWPVIDVLPPPDHRDYYGGPLDNGTNITFSSLAHNGEGGDWSTIDVYFMTAPTNNPLNYSAPVSVYTAFPGLERLYRATSYGKPQPLGPAGHYVIMLHQWNEAGALGTAGPPPPRFVSHMLITTNYFQSGNTFKVAHDGPEGIGEGTVTYLGANKYLMIARRDGVGILVYESSDGGDTWTDRGRCNLGYYDNEDAIITQPVWDNGLLNIMYQNRSSGYIELSRNNDPNVFFNQSAPWGSYQFNPPELWYKNNTASDGIFVGLGYGDMILLDSVRKVYLIAWSKEINREKAVLMWTRSKIDNDPVAPDPVPVIASSFVTSTRIRFDIPRGDGITGYTEAQFQLPRWYMVDLATDAGFTVFPTVNWHAIKPDSTINNKRINSDWMLFNNLTPNTTYYFRMKAVNLAGEAAYKTVSVTTLP